MYILVIAAFVLILFSGMYFFQEKMIFLPEVLNPDYEFSFNEQFDEWNISVEEDVTINALHFKVEEPKGVILYAHGNAGSLRSWGFVAETFLPHDYDVLIYDYRGYGKSGGKISEQALYKDAGILYKELLNRYKEEQIIIYGRSIGTGIAMELAANNNPKRLILESPYYNLPDLASHLLPIVPKFLVRYQFRNNEKIGKVSCPITIIHGTSDEVIYFGSSKKLEKLFKENDRLIPVEGGHHNDLVEFETFHREIELILR